MIELRELLEADAFTPVEVAAHAVPGSRWISVDAAEDLIERLHPAKAPDPRGRLAAAGPTSGVTSPGPAAGTPRSAAGPEPRPRPAAPA